MRQWHQRFENCLGNAYDTQNDAREVRLLETEIRHQEFEGIISLHTDDTSAGVYGFAYYGTETDDLLHDALQTAHHALPRCRSTMIDGFPANNAIVRECYIGVLSAPPEQQQRPWEIILETPQREPQHLQRQAFVLAVAMISRVTERNHPEWIRWADAHDAKARRLIPFSETAARSDSLHRLVRRSFR